jgi:predicted transcriptional regulator
MTGESEMKATNYTSRNQQRASVYLKEEKAHTISQKEKCLVYYSFTQSGKNIMINYKNIHDLLHIFFPF